MDWKVICMTFSAVFIAELADKTQLVGIGLAGKTGKPISVWIGSVCGYMLVTVISVLVGAVAGKFIHPDVIRYVGAFLFLVIAILMFFKLL